VKPSVLCLELLEVWPHWVKACERAEVPVVVINARVSERTLKARWLLRSSFERLSLVLAQRPLDAERAVMMGAHPERVHVCGNSKYDALFSSVPSSASLSTQRPLQFIFGSLRPEDERGLMSIAPSLRGVNVLIAPRYPARAPLLKQRLTAMGLSVSLRSASREEPLLHWVEAHKGASLLLLDTLGELSKLYPYTEAALLGGSFRGRPQNMIEAARSGCAIAYGPSAASALSLEVEALEVGGLEADEVSAEGGVMYAKGLDEAVRWALNARALQGEALESRLASLERLRGASDRQWAELKALL
jgi:3-deoxy-D-manno-octulosonic-acid transferase